MDVCGTCGGTVTDPAQCDVGQQDCELVPPTKDMVKIGKTLMQQAKKIDDRIKADVKRAKDNKCKIDTASYVAYSKQVLKNTMVTVRTHIIRSVQVCGDECIEVNFDTIVTDVSKELKALGIKAQALAKDVVNCSKRRVVNKNVRLPDTQDVLAGIAKEIKNTQSNCTVCK